MEFHSKDPSPQTPVRVNAQKAFTKDDKTGHMLDGIGWKVMDLNPIDMKKSQEKWVKRKRKTTGKMISKHYPLKAIRTWEGSVC